MTHDELLAKLTDYEAHFDQVLDEEKAYDALRAVVELHKPDVRGNCDICSWVSGGFVVYSICPTIQAIEKELK